MFLFFISRYVSHALLSSKLVVILSVLTFALSMFTLMAEPVRSEIRRALDRTDNQHSKDGAPNVTDSKSKTKPPEQKPASPRVPQTHPAFAKELVLWQSKGVPPKTIGLERDKTADLGRDIAELVGYNPFRIVTAAGEIEVVPGLDKELADRINSPSANGGTRAEIGLVLPLLPGQPAVEARLHHLGAKVVRPLTPHGYAVKARGEVLQRLSQDSLIYAITQCPWELKLDPALSQALGLSAGKPTAQGGITLIEADKVTVQLYDPEDRVTVEQALGRLGVSFDGYDERVRLFQLSGVEAASVTALAQMPEVAFVEAVRRHNISGQ